MKTRAMIVTDMTTRRRERGGGALLEAIFLFTLIGLCGLTSIADAQNQYLPFESASWSISLVNASTVLLRGRIASLSGLTSETKSYFLIVGNGMVSVMTADRVVVPIPGSVGLNTLTMGSGSVVRLGEGTTLLSVAAATSQGGVQTFIASNLFYATSPPTALPSSGNTVYSRSGGSLLRVRGWNTKDTRYFLLGGSQAAIEEFAPTAGTGFSEGTWSDTGAAIAEALLMMGGNVAVFYPAQYVAFGVYSGPALAQGGGGALFASIVTFNPSTNAPQVTSTTPSFSIYGKIITSVTSVESYVILVTTATLTVFIGQFGGPEGGTQLSLQVTVQDSQPNIMCTFSASAFVSVKTNTLIVGCQEGETVATSALFPSTITKAELYLSPHGSSHQTSAATVLVEYVNYPTTALAMLSPTDDCSSFFPDGPFSFGESTNGTLNMELRDVDHVVSGEDVFLCTTLGYCPSSPSCSTVMDVVTCLTQGLCIYQSDAVVTCCPREAFAVTAGTPPAGSLWMLAYKGLHLQTLTPTIIETATVSLSNDVSSKSRSETVTSTRTPPPTPSASRSVTPSGATITSNVTITTTVTNSSSMSVSGTRRNKTHSVTPSASGGDRSRSISIKASATRLPTVSASSALTASSSATAGFVTITKTNHSIVTPTANMSISVSPSNSVSPLGASGSATKSATKSLTFALIPPSPNHQQIILIGSSVAAACIVLAIVIGLVYRRRRLQSNRAWRGAISSSAALNEDTCAPAITPRGGTAAITGGGGGTASGEDTALITRDYDATAATTSGLYSSLIKSNKYTLSKLLGKGGYGMVFLAIRNSDQRKAALKYITCRTDYDRQLALKEFEVIMKVKHPNMIPIWDFFLNWQEHVDASAFGGGKKGAAGAGPLAAKSSAAAAAAGSPVGFLGEQSPFQTGDDAATALSKPRYVAIVTQYYPEGDLKRYCYTQKRQGKQLSEELIVSLMTQMTTLVVRLHDEEQQIVHRDLKPENILLDCGYKKAIVTDFGLAFNNVNEASHMTTQAGSLPFVAPECWSKHYNCKVDVWSLGCLLYALCTQRVTGDDSRVMFNDVDEPWFESELRRETVTLGQYSMQLFQCMMKMLTKNPLHRPTAHQVELMLCDIIDDREYSEEFISRTPLPRPLAAVQREEREDRQRRETEEKLAAEAAARKKAREARKQQKRDAVTNDAIPAVTPGSPGST